MINLKTIILIILLVGCSHQEFRLEDNISSIREPANFQDCFKVMESFFQKVQLNSNNFLPNQFKTLEDLEASYADYSLIDIQKSFSAQKISEMNKKTMTLLEAPLVTSQTKGFTNYLTTSEIDLIYKELANEKVHKNHACYDPNGTVGFCFGRATIVHMEALIRGVNPDAIRKIWIAGDMKEWGHHVATMVKGEKGWYVIDTNIGHAVLASDWFKFYQPFKNKNAKEIMVFVTRADRFGPYDSQNYNGINLFNSNTSHYERSADFYRGYFYDYFEALDKERLEVKKFPER